MIKRKINIPQIVKNMTLEQKIGQCLTFGFSGSIITDDLLEAMEICHCGGFRLSPYSNNFEYKIKSDQIFPYELDSDYRPVRDKMIPVSIGPYYTPSEYAAVLDQLQKMARTLNNGIPLRTIKPCIKILTR